MISRRGILLSGAATAAAGGSIIQQLQAADQTQPATQSTGAYTPVTTLNGATTFNVPNNGSSVGTLGAAADNLRAQPIPEQGANGVDQDRPIGDVPARCEPFQSLLGRPKSCLITPKGLS